MIVYQDEYGEVLYRDSSTTGMLPRATDKVHVSGILWIVREVIFDPVAKNVTVVITADEDKKIDLKENAPTDIFSFQRKLESVINKQKVQDKNISLFVEQFTSFKNHVNYSLKKAAK